jgi:hypothetical protein
MYTFGISFDGSYTFLGGRHKSGPFRIIVYSNILGSGKIYQFKK